MTEDEYTELLKDRSAEPRVYTSDFDGHDRTLLYGYTVERNGWHVYLKGGLLWQVEYSHRNERIRAYRSAANLHTDSVIPSKRVYPDATDFQMAERLQALGVSVPYTNWSQDRYNQFSTKGPFLAPIVR